MDYGHVGHHRHHNHRNDNNDDDDNTNYPPPPPHLSHAPPPSYGGAYDPSYPPPPPHGDSYDQPPPYGGAYNSPPPLYGGAYDQPPPYGGAYNSPPPPYGGGYDSSYTPPPSYGGGYDSSYPPPPSEDEYEGGGGSPTRPHRFQPHMPGFMGSHLRHGEGDHSSSTHGYGGGPDETGSLENKPSYKFVSRAGGDRYAVGIRDEKVVLTHPDTSDLTQHWCKDERYSTKIKDKDGYPSFILINKGTGQAIKHSVSCHPVQLGPYEPGVFDESVLWTESRDMGSGFRTIRTVNNIHLVMDAWNADKDHGGIHDGTLIALYETWKGDNHNQQWKLIRH